MHFFSNKLPFRISNIHSTLLLSCALMVLSDSPHADPIAQAVNIGVDIPDVATLTTRLTETPGYITSLEKYGTGTLVLNPTSANSYTGPTHIYDGTLRLISSNSLPATNIIINSGTLQAGAAVTLSSDNTIYLTGPGTIDAQSYALTLNGHIYDNGYDLTLKGAGPITFGAANVFTGRLLIGDGETVTTLILSASTTIAGTHILVQEGTLLKLVGAGIFSPAPIDVP